jgi:hypothetical protein
LVLTHVARINYITLNVLYFVATAGVLANTVF